MALRREAEAPTRPERLRKIVARAEASVEREGGLLPATCVTCHAVLGLVIPGGAIWCVDCGEWVEPDGDLGVDLEMRTS